MTTTSSLDTSAMVTTSSESSENSIAAGTSVATSPATSALSKKEKNDHMNADKKQKEAESLFTNQFDSLIEADAISLTARDENGVVLVPSRGVDNFENSTTTVGSSRRSVKWDNKLSSSLYDDMEYDPSDFPGEEHGDEFDPSSSIGDRMDRRTLLKKDGKRRKDESLISDERHASGSTRFSRMEALGEVETFPSDCYSFMANYSPFEQPGYFFFGFMVFCFQILFLIYMVLSQVAREFTSNGEIDNPSDDPFAAFIPANVTTLVRSTQVTAVLSYCIFADSSLKDCVMGIEMFPRYDRAKPGDKFWLVAISCILRFLQGLLATFATLLLIITADDVVEIILNFAAVNYISTLDEAAFELAKWGKYGPCLEQEAKSVEKRPIPYCLYRKYNHVRYIMTIIPITLTLMFITGGVIYGQENSEFWVTKTMRVQFQDSTGLQEYSGCYELAPGISHFKRRNYNGFKANPSPGVVGYCKKKRQWLLFKNEGDYLEEGGISNNPCNVTRENELAHSATTDSFDISSSFDQSWYSASGTPLDLYFFDSAGMGDDLVDTCESFLNNGRCDDTFFNTLGYQYDGGDCCASTCTKPNCGAAGVTKGFGIEGLIGDGYPNCKNPIMEPLTIYLNDVRSSRDRSVLSITDVQEEEYFREKGIDFWTENPNTPFFILDCDDTNVFSIYINKTCEKQSETVMVEDGARCKISVTNTTNFFKKWDNDPIWWVNYTIYHGNDTTNEMINGYSGFEESMEFYRIPECYFERLKTSTEVSTAYTANTPSSKALDWLAKDTSGFSNCNGDFLEERFALASINFAAPIITNSSDRNVTLWISTQQQCRWQNIACNEGSVETLAVRSKSLDGTIPSTVGLLTGLRRMDYDSNGLYGTIPSEIGLLTNLKGLDIDNNKLTGTIPTELGNLVNMVELDLDKNELTGTIPTEFGQMINAREFDLIYNRLSGPIPTEIGYLVEMATLSFVGNQLTGTIPTEIGLMPNLEIIQLSDNQVSGTIPIEIQSTKKTMKMMWLSKNNMSGPLPPQLGKLTKLRELRLDTNTFTGSIPTEIGLMTSLSLIAFQGNQLRGTIPSEIGLLTNLREIRLEENFFTGTIPMEIALLERLRILTFDRDRLDEEGSFIPNNIKTLKPCNLCEGGNYTLIRNNDSVVFYENGEYGIDSFSCPDLLLKKWDPEKLISENACVTITQSCISCGEGPYQDGEESFQDVVSAGSNNIPNEAYLTSDIQVR